MLCETVAPRVMGKVCFINDMFLYVAIHLVKKYFMHDNYLQCMADLTQVLI